MPAFAESAGGMLTDAQIDVITKGICLRWSQRGVLNVATAPSYVPKSTGDAQRGEVAYKSYCESCHGPGGSGGRKGSTITDDSFLALDPKSTRLNSSHTVISYAVFCLKKKEFGAEGVGLCSTEHMFFGEGKIGPMSEVILA